MELLKKGNMKFKYYCQYQAEDYAKSILPVPKDYPLKKGLPIDFRQKFSMGK